MRGRIVAIPTPAGASSVLRGSNLSPEGEANVSKEEGEKEKEKEEEVWGVSFLGGDPCASKLNDDPFGEQEEKPDAWLEFRTRIESKLKELKRKELVDAGIDPDDSEAEGTDENKVWTAPW
jgi:hypothetical protein